MTQKIECDQKMKRQTKRTKGKEKGKTVDEEGKEEVKRVVEEMRDGVVAAEEMLMDYMEEWQWLWRMGDEQMSWGTLWCPIWDMEFMGEAYEELYGDVVWDYDIWDLKGIKEIPNP